MRAITLTQFGGPEVLTVGDVERPTLKPAEVLIRTAAAGVNRADLLQRQGHYPPPKGTSEIIGLEVSGHIEEIGEDVTGWSVGDPCVALLAGGGYADYVAVDAGQVIPPPPGVDLITAAGLLEVAATVISNMDHVRLADGETFLVHGGAGGIGSFAIQYAKSRGCTVAATAGTEEKLEVCRELGADIAIDYHDDWPTHLREATEGHGADVILDVMGAKYLDANVTSLARLGRLVVIGLQGGIKGELNLNKLLSKAGTVTATSLRFRPTAEKAAICARVRDEVWPLISSGQIRLAGETRFPIERVREAHEWLASGENVGKIVLTF
ncbi:NAD(P)H-quinone oxidoreductase [Propioniciclava tarda]|uniref:NAD(P)H-quinone oxidoreductase n=1 Tax=Propioniciclava tarda TaxID=433330 RepID=A0A4Q9KKX2_PROTD|nr:NAD(P)H-quinone oxidoreductase [Propioniciclava tarda]TBT94845.1 NAD(P)H-quinone oxidoreductase [Propioniciclava tarda]SMO63390.1 putative NAD(P)H quinone oxidoreductase, PIG3 family [Propioniciclava tarda]HQD61391.1 NAD(P)H-quinone oxidoreductase [Propioniciclava tarda]